MKITRDATARSVLVQGLGLIQKDGQPSELEPVFVLRASDQFSDGVLRFYQNLAAKNVGPQAQASLQKLMAEFSKWPKRPANGDVRYQEAPLQGNRLMDEPLAWVDGQLYKFEAAEVIAAMKAILKASPREAVSAPETSTVPAKRTGRAPLPQIPDPAEKKPAAQTPAPGAPEGGNDGSPRTLHLPRQNRPKLPPVQGKRR